MFKYAWHKREVDRNPTRADHGAENQGESSGGSEDESVTVGTGKARMENVTVTTR